MKQMHSPLTWITAGMALEWAIVRGHQVFQAWERQRRALQRAKSVRVGVPVKAWRPVETGTFDVHLPSVTPWGTGDAA